MISGRYLFLVFFTISSALDDDPVVDTRYGRIMGRRQLSENGREFFSFKGIPYARPPVGPLRFKPPQPLNPWLGTLNAQKDPPPCMQKNYLFGKSFVEGSEDCLFLNVYTPKSSSQKPLPVMVFIHWGGFFTGYSSSDFLGPEYFMDSAEVVLVTFNYRLGVLGFLSTFDDESPGNYGLKDQHAVLEWVLENIGGFGGNKGRVTIFGQSAGGASVHLHMLRPEASRLFHRAISESGTALALWAKPLDTQSLVIAQYQATLMGCKDTLNTSNLVQCLRTVDAASLVQSGDKFKIFSIDPLTVYMPAIEKKTEKNPHPFLTQQPLELIKNKHFHVVPWIVGTVGNEGILRAAALVLAPCTRASLNNFFDRLMPPLIYLGVSTGEEEKIWGRIKKQYTEGIDVNNSKSIQGLIDLYTDRGFAYSTYQAIRMHLRGGHENIWLYSFNYEGRHSYRKYFAKSTGMEHFEWGVSHCDELLYLFKSPAIFPNLQDRNDISMRQSLVGMWTYFAKTGRPTKKGGEINWTNASLKGKNLTFLNITGRFCCKNSIKFSMESGFYNDRLRFWEELPLVENIQELKQNHVDLK